MVVVCVLHESHCWCVSGITLLACASGITLLACASGIKLLVCASGIELLVCASERLQHNSYRHQAADVCFHARAWNLP